MASFAQLSGGREMVDAEKAEALLNSISVPDPVHIRLSNKSFDNGAAERIASYLRTLTALRIADISDIIAGRPEDEALRTLELICSGLEKFDLIEINVSDNAFGGKGIESCRSILKKKTIQRLYMCNNGLSAEACGLVCNILLEGGCPPLTLLHFYNNMSGSAGAVAVSDILRACPQLEDFRFSATRSGPEGCLAIAKALSSLRNLKRLDLSDNNIGAEASAELAECLQSRSGLESLCLRDGGLTAEGVESLLGALGEDGEGFRSLNHLDLSGNEIDESLAEQLAGSLKALGSLTHLQLDDNELTSEGAKHIADAIKHMPQLRTLSCTGCEIGASGAYALARAVSRLPAFLTLQLNGNEVAERAVDEIKTLFNKHSKILGDMEDNDADGEDDLEEELAAEEQDYQAAEQEAKVDDVVTDELISALEAAAL